MSLLLMMPSIECPLQEEALMSVLNITAASAAGGGAYEVWAEKSRAARFR